MKHKLIKIFVMVFIVAPKVLLASEMETERAATQDNISAELAACKKATDERKEGDQYLERESSLFVMEHPKIVKDVDKVRKTELEQYKKVLLKYVDRPESERIKGMVELTLVRNAIIYDDRAFIHLLHHHDFDFNKEDIVKLKFSAMMLEFLIDHRIITQDDCDSIKDN